MKPIYVVLAAVAAAGGQAPALIEGAGYFPVAVRLKSSEVMVVHRSGGAHLGRGGRLDTVISRDGRSWEAPKTVADGPEDDRNPALGQLRDGTIILAYAIASGYDAEG